MNFSPENETLRGPDEWEEQWKNTTVYTSCLFLRLQKCLQQLLHKHSLTVPCAAAHSHFLKCFSPLSLLCIISLCCIIVTVINRYSIILRADLFLWISLLMFADLFYILAGKSSKKWLNLLTIQFNLSFSGQTSSVFQILIKWKQTKKKKRKRRWLQIWQTKVYFSTRQKLLLEQERHQLRQREMLVITKASKA